MYLEIRSWLNPNEAPHFKTDAWDMKSYTGKLSGIYINDDAQRKRKDWTPFTEEGHYAIKFENWDILKIKRMYKNALSLSLLNCLLNCEVWDTLTFECALYKNRKSIFLKKDWNNVSWFFKSTDAPQPKKFNINWKDMYDFKEQYDYVENLFKNKFWNNSSPKRDDDEEEINIEDIPF